MVVWYITPADIHFLFLEFPPHTAIQVLTASAAELFLRILSVSYKTMPSCWFSPQEYLLGVGLWHFEQLDETVEQWHADGPQQHLEAGLHQLGQALHQAALTAVHLVVRSHHVRNEGVVGWARLLMQETVLDWDLSAYSCIRGLVWHWNVCNSLAKRGCIVWLDAKRLIPKWLGNSICWEDYEIILKTLFLFLNWFCIERFSESTGCIKQLTLKLIRNATKL